MFAFKSGVAAVAALTLAAAAGAVHAQSFEDFDAFCIAPDGEAMAAVTAAKAAGWSRGPDELLASLAGDDQLRVSNALLPPGFPAGMLIVGEGGAEMLGTIKAEADICMVINQALPAVTATAALRARLGIGAPADTDDGAMWVFSRTSGVLKPEAALMDAPDEVILARMRQVPIFLAGVVADADHPESSVLVFAHFRVP